MLKKEGISRWIGLYIFEIYIYEKTESSTCRYKGGGAPYSYVPTYSVIQILRNKNYLYVIYKSLPERRLLSVRSVYLTLRRLITL